MAIPRKLFNLVPNPMMEFDQQELLAKRYVKDSYIGKVTPSAISLWQLYMSTNS